MDGNSNTRLVVVFLGIVSCLAIAGMVWTEAAGHAAPASLAVIAGQAVGALVGILVPTARRPSKPGH